MIVRSIVMVNKLKRSLLPSCLVFWRGCALHYTYFGCKKFGLLKVTLKQRQKRQNVAEKQKSVSIVPEKEKKSKFMKRERYPAHDHIEPVKTVNPTESENKI